MNNFEMRVSFQREINQYENAPYFNEVDIYYWLNQAVEKFIETRLSGNNFKGESLEQGQKRLDDLRSLIVQETISGGNLTEGTAKTNSYLADLTSLSSTYKHRIGEEVTIQYTDALGIVKSKRQGVTECTSDTYRSRIDDPFGDYRLQYGEAKPLRLFIGDDVELITDGNYSVTAYHIVFLRNPAVLTSDGGIDCDLAEHTHREIVKMAVNLALENIGSNRYQTSSVEIQNME
jgi:hypothetical protein